MQTNSTQYHMLGCMAASGYAHTDGQSMPTMILSGIEYASIRLGQGIDAERRRGDT